LNKQYDVIALDAYKPPYVPWHLTTVEFFQEVNSKLKDTGVLTINTYRPQDDRRLVEALSTTLYEVFDSIYTVDEGDYNTIIFATKQTTDESYVQTNYQKWKSPDNIVLRKAHKKINAGMVDTIISDIIFTDEVAPVEPLIDSMLLRMILNYNKDSES
jgi:spermidine synthase